MSIPDKSDEQLFLEGPRSRWRELGFAIKVLFEFIKGFRRFHFLGPCVTIFGSARFPDHHPYYEQTRQIGGELARLGFTVMTGGGPGLMEAANRGAKRPGANRLDAISFCHLSRTVIPTWTAG